MPRVLCARAITILVTFGVLAGSTGLHQADDDLLCGLGPVHDASAHRVGPSRDKTASEPSHCFLCHWQRSFRTVLVAIAGYALSIHALGPVDAATAVLPFSVVDFSVPARAPPA